MALILSGDTGVPASGMPTGSVIQTVTGTYTTQTSTTSTSYSSTGFSASITPTSATSKILVLVNMRPGIVVSSQAVSFQLWRGGASIFQIGTNTAYVNATGVAEVHGSASSCYLDSPATTSSVTYTIYYATLNSGQLAYNNINADTSTITLLEIKQ